MNIQNKTTFLIGDLNIPNLPTDKMLDAEEKSARQQLEKNIKAKRDEISAQKIRIQGLQQQLDNIVSKMMNSSTLFRLKEQFKKNEIVDFNVCDIDEKYNDVLKGCCIIKSIHVWHSILLIMVNADRNSDCFDININLHANTVSFNGAFDINKTDVVVKVLTFLLDNLDILMDINKKSTDDETKKHKLESSRGLYRYFDKSNIDEMTVIKNIENPSHWAWGADFYLFVYRGKLYHFEAYNRGINLPVRDPNIINYLSVFNEVQNTGNGDNRLPVVQKLYNIFETNRDGAICHILNIENL